MQGADIKAFKIFDSQSACLQELAGVWIQLCMAPPPRKACTCTKIVRACTALRPFGFARRCSPSCHQTPTLLHACVVMYTTVTRRCTQQSRPNRQHVGTYSRSPAHASALWAAPAAAAGNVTPLPETGMSALMCLHACYRQLTDMLHVSTARHCGVQIISPTLLGTEFCSSDQVLVCSD